MGKQKRHFKRKVIAVKAGIRFSKKPRKSTPKRSRTVTKPIPKTHPVGPKKSKASIARLERLKKQNEIAENLISRMQNLDLEEPTQLQMPTKEIATRRASTSKQTVIGRNANYVTINKLARNLKRQLKMKSTQISPMTLRNGKTKHNEL